MTIVRTRALPAFAAGLRAVASRPRLIAAVWAWQLVVATALSLPLFRGLVTTTAYTPAADVLLERFSFGLFAELLRASQAPLLAMLQAGAFGGVLIAIVTAPLLLAAIITSIEREGRVMFPELASAAGLFYWPFLRLLVFGRGVGLLAAGLVGGAFSGAMRPVRRSLWEAGRLGAGFVVMGGALVALALFWAAVDYAMIHAVRTGSRRMFAAWRMGLRATFTRPITTLGLWLLAGVLLVALASVLFVVFDPIPATSGVLIALAFVVLQVFMTVRIGLRVALVGAEAAAWRIVPEAASDTAAVPIAAPPPDEPAAG